MSDPLRASIDHLLEGLQVIDRDWRYVYLNATAATQGQRAAADLIGRTMMEAYPGIDQTDLFKTLQRVMTTRRPEALRNEFAFPSGERRWFDLVVNPVPDGICILSLDVTDRRRVELELHHAQRMDAIGKLAGGVAHDFNNQLTAILGFTQLRLETEQDPHARQELQAIYEAAQRSASLTRQLLTFSHRQPISIQPIDINDVVSRIEKLLQHVLPAAVTCEVRRHESPAMILGDAQQLENALTNLAVNARDAMPSGGRLTITTAIADLTEEDARQHPQMAAGSYAVLTVADTGRGMDDVTRQRIFEPFFTTKGADHGTGLGLSLVYGIVKRMEGFIWVYSEVGRGTTFKLYFPTTTASRIARVVDAPRRAHGRRATILVVEDDLGVRNLITRALTRIGHSVLEAGTGADARLRVRGAAAPDLVLTDVVLPDETGPALVADLSLANVKVVLMSGYSERQMPAGSANPDYRLLEKPFTVQDLLRTVDAALGWG